MHCSELGNCALVKKLETDPQESWQRCPSKWCLGLGINPAARRSPFAALPAKETFSRRHDGQAVSGEGNLGPWKGIGCKNPDLG